MQPTTKDWRERIERDGYAIVPGVFPQVAVDRILAGLADALAAARAESTKRRQNGSVYRARNLLRAWPPVRDRWRRPPLPAILSAILGPDFGLVRVLYFDKPPDRSWSLPWHKDLTIAVRDNTIASDRFTHPTRKAGVPHVEAPRELLETMLTARIHLDEVTDENGPLKVVPGSHLTGKSMPSGDAAPAAILAQAGDVLLMRPLLAHASGNSHPETRRHRRILHLEFAATEALPDGYAWHDYVTGAA